MCPIAISLDETWEYQLKEDRVNKEEVDENPSLRLGAIHPDRAVFDLGGLSVPEEAELKNSLAAFEFDTEKGDGVDGATAFFRAGSQELFALERGLRGWRNFFHADGSVAPFKDKGARGGGRGPRRCDVNCCSVLSGLHRTELSNAIVERYKVTPTESDSSGPSPISSGSQESQTVASANAETTPG